MAKTSAFIRFSRLHTIIATSLQVLGIFILAHGFESLGDGGLAVLVLALIACLAANIYVVGLNQLADVEIDRINKPYLPLATGEFTLRQGRWIVFLLGLLAVGLAVSQGPYLLMTIGLTMIVGTAYSLPPFHLKIRPLLAALSIAFVRGFVANVGMFLYFNQRLQSFATVPWPLVLALALFFFGFGLVIALYKDIPDLSGDRQFGIRTFTVRLGPQAVFRGGRLILTVFYLLPILLALALLPRPEGVALLVTHLAIVIVFWSVSLSIDPIEPVAFTRFYMFLWSLFYIEYLLLSFTVLAGQSKV